MTPDPLAQNDPLTQAAIHWLEEQLGRELPAWVKVNLTLGPVTINPQPKQNTGNTTLDPPTLIRRLDTMKRRARIARDRSLTSIERAQWQGRWEAYRDARDLVEQSLTQEQIA